MTRMMWLFGDGILCLEAGPVLLLGRMIMGSSGWGEEEEDSGGVTRLWVGSALLLGTLLGAIGLQWASETVRRPADGLGMLYVLLCYGPSLCLAQRALGIPLDVLALGLAPLQPVMLAATMEDADMIDGYLRPALDVLGVGSMLLAWAAAGWWPVVASDWATAGGVGGDSAWRFGGTPISSLFLAILLARYLCAVGKGRTGVVVGGCGTPCCWTFCARLAVVVAVVWFEGFPVTALALAAILSGPASFCHVDPARAAVPVPERIILFLLSLLVAVAGSAATPLWPSVLAVVGAVDLLFL